MAHLVDGRDLLPPEPMQRTLEALQSLPPGEELTLLLFREPFPLYSVLQSRGYVHRTELAADGTYSIHIRRG